MAAGGILTVTADSDHATAKVTDLTLGGGLAQLPPELREGLQQISTVCAQLPAEPDPDVDEQLLGQLPVGLQELIDTPGNLRDLCGVVGDGTFAELAGIDTLQTECTDDSGTVAVSNARIFGSTTPLNDTGGDLSAIQAEDGVPGLRLCEIVGGDQDPAPIAGELGDQLLERSRGRPVQPGERLVQQQDPRVRDQCPRDQRALALPARELAEGLVRQFLKPHLLEGLSGPGPLRPAGTPPPRKARLPGRTR